jgi:parallel beta-helix repeat protein
MNRTPTNTAGQSNTTFVLTSLALLITSGVLSAGPLSPPAGPVTNTGKALAEVEPRTAVNATNTPGDNDASPSLFKITQPGSYYLTGNVAGVVGKYGIEIASSGVTLDLNGFELLGVPGTLDGVIVTSGVPRNIAVSNGSVRNWGGNGADLRIANTCRIEGVLASGNAGVGIAAGPYSVISNVTARNNLFGISAGDSSVITGCTANSNTSAGFGAGVGCTIANCTASFNAGPGFDVLSGCTIVNCTAANNTDFGFTTGSGATVTSCTAHNNSGVGIAVTTASTVSDCTVSSSSRDGIRCASRCLIRNNTCNGQGGGLGLSAGIHATGSGNRIEGNNCSNADRGIDVDSDSNFIVRNTCSGNTLNWTIAAGNVVGTIVDRTSTGNAAIIGNSAPSSLGTTDANANFTY